MRRLLLASVAALATLTAPVVQAQTIDGNAHAGAHSPVPTDGPALTMTQKGIYDGWSPQQKLDYDSWPNDYKSYYWSLNNDQQSGYWALSQDQRGQFYRMTPQQRKAAWRSVAQQMSGQMPSTPAGQANPPGLGMPTNGVPDPQMADQTVRPAMPADPGYQGSPYKGALTPPPASAMNKDYPRCSATVQDGCVNPGGQ